MVVDPDGQVWYTDFGNQIVGELDPKTGKVVGSSDFRCCEPEQPKGSLDIELDPDGNLWVGMSYQAGASKIDRKTKKVTTYPLNGMAGPQHADQHGDRRTHMDVDGKVWMTDNADPHTSTVSTSRPASGRTSARPRTPSGSRSAATAMPTDKRQQRLHAGVRRHQHRHARRQDRRGQDLADADRALAAAPRPGRRTSQLWFAEYGGNAIGMFDPKTETHQGVEAADAVERAL